MRMLLPDEGQRLAVRFPRDRRHRRTLLRPTFGKAPQARGQSLCFFTPSVFTLGGRHPNMRRSRCARGQVAVVPYFERVVMLLNLFLVERIVARDVRDVIAFGR